jgi:CubicO group peptidase (beta-lactamase class C family)
MDDPSLDAFLAPRADDPSVGGFLAQVRRPDGQVYRREYHGSAGVDASIREDSMIRWYSNSKIFAGVLAAMCKERGWLSYDDPVEKFLPAFGRKWDVICPIHEHEVEGKESTFHIEWLNKLTNERRKLFYVLEPVQRKMLVQHCLSESAGIGYEMFADILPSAPESPDLGPQKYGIASALRQGAAERRGKKQYYTSTSIVGMDLNLSEFCDVVCEAGVLVEEPGSMSYGHGATVVGRICEVCYNNNVTHANVGDARYKFLQEIMQEMLFTPLGMKDATFFLGDGDPRIARVPMCYGTASDDGKLIPHRDCFAPEVLGSSTNCTDHFEGPRTCESLDTGLLMPIADYCRVLEMLLNKGKAASLPLLSEHSVREILYTRFEKEVPGYWQGTPIGAVAPAFGMGWVAGHEHADVPVCFWGGYAQTNAMLFPKHGVYAVLAPQVIGPYTPNDHAKKFGTEVQAPLLQHLSGVLSGGEPP